MKPLQRQTWPQLFVRLSIVAIALLLALGSQAARVQALSTGVVISQVYGGGGNTGAQYQNDFIELFNRGTITVSVAGWSVQYTSATGTGNFGSATNLITPLSGSLAPGQYTLVQEASGTSCSGLPCGSLLPSADITDTTPINMAAGGGKVALVNTTTPLGCNGSTTPCSSTALATIVDLIGWDGANFFEGSGPGPTTTNTTAAFRAVDGCQDTDNNSVDFTSGAPAPRNSASPLKVCPLDIAPTVSSTTPANSDTSIALDANISINFSEAVNVTGSWFTISCATSGSHSATVSGGPTNFTLNPDVDFASNESCTVTVLASQVTDQDLIDPPDNMTADYVFSFTTLGPPTFIHDIQAASHISPLNGQLVSNVNGIVTAKRSNGFYMQDPNSDSDDATSEGIFVFTSSAPAVNAGDAVRVGGTVQEFRPGGASTGNLTTTEIGSPGRTVTVLSSGNPLPPPIVVGTGGRVPPNQNFEDDSTGCVSGSGNVETCNTFDPSQDGIDFWESLEGMLVQFNNPVAVGPASFSIEIPIVGDMGAHASLRTARGGVIVQPGSFNPERVVLNNAINGSFLSNNVSVGDYVNGSVVGVMDYNFGNFFLETIAPVSFTSGGLTRETTTPQGTNQVAIGTFNVQNLAPSDPPSKYSTLAGLIVNNLKSPDVIGVEEIQDNSGATDDHIVDATTTWTMLINAVSSAGGPTYGFRQIDPVDDQDGGAPGGNIRQGFLFRTDRGLSFVDRACGGCNVSTDAVSIVNTASGPQLSWSPGRIDPQNAAWNITAPPQDFKGSRKPIVGEFMFNSHHFFVIANHFASKGGDDPLMGKRQPPFEVTKAQRLAQAQVEHDFVQNILAADANADVVVVGDLNDFQFSDPVMTLTGENVSNTILKDLIDTLPANERYSYDFEGNSETLDHLLIGNHLFNNRPYTEDVVHVNSEFFDQASDHEPQVATVLLNDPPTADAGGPYGVNEGGSVIVSASGTDPESGPLTYAWDLDNNGTFETPGQSVSFSAAGLDGPSTKTIKVQVTDNGGLTASASATVTVNNVPPTVNTPSIVPEPSTEGSAAVASAGFSDPGVNDAPFSCTVNYGDGSGALTGTVSANVCAGPSHAYSTFGTYAVVIAVTDKDHGTGNNTAMHTVIYNFSGFFQPVDNLPVFNSTKAGGTVPVKFALGGNKGLNIFASSFPKSEAITCNSSAPVEGIEETLTAGTSSLSFDPATGQYIYVWKTDKAWAGTCRQLVLKLIDGTLHRANFMFTK